MKAKLEDWNEIWRKLESQFCILAQRKCNSIAKFSIFYFNKNVWSRTIDIVSIFANTYALIVQRFYSF